MNDQMPKLDLIKKQVDKDGYQETRWFVNTGDGFDGTAQGYGYKTPQAIYKAYYYFLNKNKFAKQKQEIKQFLKDNADIKEVLDLYFNETNSLYRLKDREETSIENLLDAIKDRSDVIEKLNKNKHLWKRLIRYYLG